MIRYLKTRYLIVFVIAFALLTTGCNSFGGNNNSNNSNNSDNSDNKNNDNISNNINSNNDNTGKNTKAFKAASEHLMTVWSDYLRVTEQMYSSEIWALDYVDAYIESGDWIDLSKARTACITSTQYIQDLSMTEKDIDETEYLALTYAGVDTTYQSSEFAKVPETLNSEYQTIGEYFLESLEADIFFESTNNNLKDRISIQKELILSMSRYMCAMTNYLLVSIGDEEMSKNYWKSMQEKYPVICEGSYEWLDHEEDIEKAAVGYLDSYEETISKIPDLIAVTKSELYDMTEIIENNDMEALIAKAHRIVNAPEMLPEPEWYDPKSAMYVSYISKEGVSAVYPHSGDNLTDKPYTVYVQIHGVTVEDVEEYIHHIEGTADDIQKSPEENRWYITMKDYGVVIHSEGESVQIIFEDENVTFAPGWYIGL